MDELCSCLHCCTCMHKQEQGKNLEKTKWGKKTVIGSIHRCRRILRFHLIKVHVRNVVKLKGLFPFSGRKTLKKKKPPASTVLPPAKRNSVALWVSLDAATPPSRCPWTAVSALAVVAAMASIKHLQ